MFASLQGADDLEAQLAAFPAALAARLETKMRELAAALAARVRDGKLSGEALNAKSGALRASIAADVSVAGETLSAAVGAYGDAKYAAIHEYGGRTSAHEILPAKAQALCFMVGGATRFARRVQHPGSNIPARSYLSSALQDSQEQIVAELSDAVAQVWS